MYRSHTCGELRLSHINQEVTLAGWVQRVRNMGGMTFIDLRDRYGITQLSFNLEKDVELCEKARKLGREFVIQIGGIVIERESKNKQLATGEIEIEVSSFSILNCGSGGNPNSGRSHPTRRINRWCSRAQPATVAPSSSVASPRAPSPGDQRQSRKPNPTMKL